MPNAPILCAAAANCSTFKYKLCAFVSFFFFFSSTSSFHPIFFLYLLRQSLHLHWANRTVLHLNCTLNSGILISHTERNEHAYIEAIRWQLG